MIFLETSRLYLRPVAAKDVPVMYDYRNNEICARYQRGQIRDLSGITAMVEDRKEDKLGVDAPFMAAVVLKDTDEMVGEIVVMPSEGTISLGYTFSYRHHRRGYSFEALSALIETLHSRYPSWDFVCFTEPENVPSMALLKKLGYKDMGYVPSMESQSFGKWLQPATEAEFAQAANQWFTIDQIDPTTYILSEYRHWEHTHCYLLIGEESALLLDTGLGIGDIGQEVAKLTDKPVTAVATHIHWDHIGGHKNFPQFFAHKEELSWLTGQFPLPLPAVKSMVTDRCSLPRGFDMERYTIFQGTPARLLEDGDIMDLGGRMVHVYHTPGHAPGHLCFWEPDRGYLYTGDLVYSGTLYADYPSTDPAAYLESLEKIASLPAKRIFPGHHSLNIQPELIRQMRDAFRSLKAGGKLCHGSGTHSFESWSVKL